MEVECSGVMQVAIKSAIQWFQIHHRITFETIQNLAVYLSGARVSIFSTLVTRLVSELNIGFLCQNTSNHVVKKLQAPYKRAC